MTIDLDDLPNLAKRAWNAIIPPLWKFTLCVIAFTYVFGLHAIAQHLGTNVGWDSMLPPPRAQKVLDFYGLTHLVPIASVLAWFFVMHGTDVIVRTVARVVPGQLTPSTTHLMLETTSEWTFHQLRRYHRTPSDIDGLNTLNTILEEEVDRASRDQNAFHRFRGVLWMRERAYQSALSAEFIKGIAVLCGAIWLAHPWLSDDVGRPTMRLLHALAVLVALYLFALRSRISLEHNYYRSRTYAYLSWKAATSDPRLDGTPDDSIVADCRLHQRLREELKEPVWMWWFWHTNRQEPALHIWRAIASPAASLGKRLHSLVSGGPPK